VVSAAYAVTEESRQFLKANDEHYECNSVPLVVTRSPIVACTLGNNGELELKRTNHCIVNVFSEQATQGVGVAVITQAALPRYIEVWRRAMQDLGMS
jgi:hypothetical protein